jgi:hypothetical protein
VAFCAVESHPPPYDQQQAFLGGWGRKTCRTHEMIDLLERALAQAESGDVPYAKDAVSLLRQELKKRQELASTAQR